MSISILGLTFHLYGLILGFATVTAFWLAEKKAAEVNLSKDCVWSGGILAILGGLVGARFWHVVTDYHLYQDNLLAVFYIWQGGLSILGGVVAGALSLYFAAKIIKSCQDNPQASPSFLADVAVFGLPMAQVVGRLANWVNGELYGIPTELPWKIFINLENRLPAYKEVAYYHPLFLYEMVMMVGFLVWAWLHSWCSNNRKIGSGFYLWSYLAYYSFVRFWLDFIRLDKALIGGTSLGVNQLVLAILFTAIVIFTAMKKYFKSKKFILLTWLGVILVWFFVWQGLSQTGMPGQLPLSTNQQRQSERNFAQLQIDDQVLQVELAETPDQLRQGLSGRDQIGADGMLFIFSQKRTPSFWMKDMQFALDMVWIADQRVVEVTANVPKPPPNTPLRELPRYSPDEPVQMVLEIPAGQASALGIARGSTVVLVK